MMVGLTLVFSVLAVLVFAEPAAAADQVVTVAPGASVGPVSVEVGDVITIVGANKTFTDVDVPGEGVVPKVVVSTTASPSSVSYPSSGRVTESIGLSYASVVFPHDVPERAILDELASVPLPDATLLVQVADPPRPPPVSSPPPVPQPPPAPQPPSAPQPPPAHAPLVVLSPTSEHTPSTATQPDRPDYASLPTVLGGAAPFLGGAPPVPVPVGPAATTEPQPNSGGSSSTDASREEFEVVTSGTDTTAASGFDELPMALGIPSLLAILSICVLGAGVGRLRSDVPLRR